MGTRPGQGRPFEPDGQVDSPAWQLVKALDTLVADDGYTPAIDGWFENVKPLTERQKQMIAADVAAANEADDKNALGHQALDQDEDYLTSVLPARLAADGQYPGAGRRLYRAGRQDRPAGAGRGQARLAAGARHDQRRSGRQAEGASRQARLRRHRGRCQRRLRPDRDRRGQRPDPRRAGGASSAGIEHDCRRATPAAGPA